MPSSPAHCSQNRRNLDWNLDSADKCQDRQRRHGEHTVTAFNNLTLCTDCCNAEVSSCNRISGDSVIVQAYASMTSVFGMRTGPQGPP